MGLTLLTGPANAGKVARLLDGFLACIDDDPFLVVPNRAEADRAERDLLARCGCLFGGTIATFDTLFRRIAEGDPGRRPEAPEATRALLARRSVAALARDGGLSRSAAFPGFADSLAAALSELEAALVDPDELGGELGVLCRRYREELEHVGLWDRDLMRRAAAERIARDLDAWHGEPVFVYGFEDLSAAQWVLLDGLAGRAEVTVSLPYEPGRVAFASLQRTAEDLAALAAGRVEELPPRLSEVAAPALAQLERGLFEPSSSDLPTGGAVRFLAGAGTRGTLELVAEELSTLIRGGTAPERIAVVLPSVEPRRGLLETVFASVGVPYGIEVRRRLGSTPLGQALLALLAFAWSGAGRRELYTFLRSPYSGLPRSSVDFTEGRLRGRAVADPARVEEETERLRGAPLPVLRELRAAPSPLEGVREVLDAMMRAAYGLEAPPVSEQARLDLRCYRAATDLLEELAALVEPPTPAELAAALTRLELPSPGAGEPGRVAVLDLLGARTRRFEVVFILGLEEGSLPRRAAGSPFIDDEQRRSLGSRLERPDPVSRDRYLFYTACTRPTERLYLVREAVSDEGVPLEQSPFWHAVLELFEPEQVARATRRRSLSELTWPLEAAPNERERLRALARLSADDDARRLAFALAAENGWTRRLDRAVSAFERPTGLVSPVVLAQLGGRSTFAATELERFIDCSSAWFFERLIDPKKIDAQADALLRGKLAHQTLYAFYSRLPKELGVERVSAETLEPALVFLARCLDEAFDSGVRLDLGEVEAAELREGLWHDLARFLHDEARAEVGFLPRRFELGFGTERSAPELQRGLALGDGLFVSGKIDRIDVDPHSARGIVQDYKSGKGSHSARQIEREGRLQVPLYMLVLRDLAGIEPLGGVYRALSGSREARGMLRASAREELPGFKANDYLDEDEFWAQVESARARALTAAQRIRGGDVGHDPRGGECPPWCQLWTMCRVRRS